MNHARPIRSRRSRAALLGLLLAAPAAAQADNGPFGLGIVLGEPSGLSAKLFVNPRHAFQFGLDFSFVEDAVYVGVDYLRHFPGIVRARTVAGYVGIGGSVSVHERDHHHDEGRLKARIPFGLAWMPRDPSIDVFLELVPVLRIVPDLEPGIAAGLGLRYFF